MEPTRSNRTLIIIALAAIVLAAIAAMVMFSRGGLMKKSKLTPEQAEAVRSELAKPAPVISEKEKTDIRAELSKPPDIRPEDAKVNPDGTIELSDEEKARIRSELSK